MYGASAKDIDWATWTCKLGFPVQHIFPGPDLTDVNHVCRSTSRKILATAEDTGLVKLFKYPNVVEGASFKEFIAHSSHVTRVQFTHNDKYLISSGGNDKSVMIWETDFNLGGDEEEEGGAAGAL